MTVADWCLLGAVLLTLATIAIPKALAPTQFDNARPRQQSFYAHPVRARALGAHINGIEVFPFFATAVLLAEFRLAPQPWIDGLALSFLVARLGFVAAYIADRPTLRTVLWNVGFASNLGIFFLAGYGIAAAAFASGLGFVFALSLWPLLTRIEKRSPHRKGFGDAR